MFRGHNSRAGAPNTTPTLACLLYRRNPRGHLSCASLKFKRPRDLKQHLLRDHRLPLYCPICVSFPFTTVEERDSHIQEGICATPPGSVLAEGLDPCQVAKLKQYRAPRGQDNVSTWNDYWAIVFPGDTCHPKANMSDHFEEVVDMISDYSNAQKENHRDEIAASFPAEQASLVFQASRRYLKTVLNGFLKRNGIANSHTATVFNPNPATAGHTKASNDGANPGLPGKDEEPHPYSGPFFSDLDGTFDWDDHSANHDQFMDGSGSP